MFVEKLAILILLVAAGLMLVVALEGETVNPTAAPPTVERQVLMVDTGISPEQEALIAQPAEQEGIVVETRTGPTQGTLIVQPAEQESVVDKTGLDLQQETLIAKHELMPGLTRSAAIDKIGTSWISWSESESDWSIMLTHMGPRGRASISDSRMTSESVIASWGTPDEITSNGSGEVYVYLQPDGELRVQFGRNDYAYAQFLNTVLGPEYFRQRFPAWTDETCGLVAAQMVALGMTAQIARASWGLPSDINRSVGSWGEHEQWVYRSYSSSGSTRYLYFENGILTSWQD